MTFQNRALEEYLKREILPRYAHFDAAHRVDHAMLVMEESWKLAELVNRSPHYRDADGIKVFVDGDTMLTIAAYHDTGLCQGRETHHLVSGQIIREDETLKQWFSPAEIERMAQAAEDHRASSKHAPRSIYGRILAEADRTIQPVDIIRRTIQYGLDHYPERDKEGHWQRTLEHLHEKYAEGGYLKLWIPESPNGERLAELRSIIRNEPQLREIFDEIWENLH